MRKTIRIIAYVVIIGLLVLLGIEWWLEGKIRRVIEQKVTEETRGQIRAEIGNVSVSLIGRSIRLTDIDLVSDPRNAADSAPILANAHINRLAVRGIHYKKADTAVFIRMRKFELDFPQGDISRFALPEARDKKKAGSRPAKSVRLMVKELNVNMGDVRYIQRAPKDTSVCRLRDFHCRMDRWTMSKAGASSRPAVGCEDMKMSFSGFRYKFAGNTQLLQVDSLYISGEEGRISVGGIDLRPLYPKAEFVLKNPRHTDWTQIHTGPIVCRGWDMQQMMKQQLLKIDSVEIRGAQISTYKNRQIEQPKQVKRLFYESVQQLPFHLTVGRIGLEDIQVEYQELSEKGEVPGTITFNQLNGTFYDLTNVVTPGHPYYTLKARGKLMGQGDLEATFRLPVDSTNQHFEVEGRMGRMDMMALNPMIEPLVWIRITSGEVDELKFAITGNAYRSHVNMLFLYKDLKVRMLKEKKDGEIKVRSFLTTLVNGLILIEDNPNHKGERRAEGNAERDVYRSQFNYLWRSLLVGLKETIGL